MFTVSRSRRLVTSTNVHTVARPATVACTDVLFSCGDKRMRRRMIGKGVITRLTTQVGLPFSAIFAFFSPIAILIVTSPVVINVPTRGLSVVETKESFVPLLEKCKYQKTCL